MIKRIGQVLFALIAAVAAVYLADLAVLRLRSDPTRTVKVHPYTEVPRNDKREEIIFDDPYDETCVHSLFPHQDDSPCWYLQLYPEKKNAL